MKITTRIEWLVRHYCDTEAFDGRVERLFAETFGERARAREIDVAICILNHAEFVCHMIGTHHDETKAMQARVLPSLIRHLKSGRQRRTYKAPDEVRSHADPA